MKRILWIAPLALVVMLGCPDPNYPPKPVPDAGGAVSCADYCGHLRALDCPQAKPTKKGATCEQVCTNLAASNYVTNTRECSMAAATCAAIDACEE